MRGSVKSRPVFALTGDNPPRRIMWPPTRPWTRTEAEGGELTVCLLDREPVLADMTGCDKYELREPA